MPYSSSISSIYAPYVCLVDYLRLHYAIMYLVFHISDSKWLILKEPCPVERGLNPGLSTAAGVFWHRRLRHFGCHLIHLPRLSHWASQFKNLDKGRKYKFSWAGIMVFCLVIRLRVCYTEIYGEIYGKSVSNGTTSLIISYLNLWLQEKSVQCHMSNCKLTNEHMHESTIILEVPCIGAH